MILCLYSLQVKRRQRVLQGRAPRRFHRCELLPGLVRRGLDVEGFGVFDTEYANQTLTESVEDRDGFEDIFARGRGFLVRKYANVHFDVQRLIVVGAEHAPGKREQCSYRAQSFIELSRLRETGGEIVGRTYSSGVLVAVQLLLPGKDLATHLNCFIVSAYTAKTICEVLSSGELKSGVLGRRPRSRRRSRPPRGPGAATP